MESYLISAHFDLTTPDGYIEKLKIINDKTTEAIVKIKNISPVFVGYHLDKNQVFFNIKSTLAQIGINGTTLDFELNKAKNSAEVKIEIKALNAIAAYFIKYLSEGCYIGKLFACDETRKVRDPEYLMRMFGRCDRFGKPLLSFGSKDREDLILEKIEGHTIAFLPLKQGIVTYDPEIKTFLPTIGKVLKHKNFKTRELLQLYQKWEEGKKRIVNKNDILLVKTAPLHIRTVFAKVSDKFLPQGYEHMSASV
ncbi:MAG: hypothetical protein HZB76_01940, partial [Chlamydiae bacterium]|nr:hypothetical protein [Chlamydiota bacterium]